MTTAMARKKKPGSRSAPTPPAELPTLRVTAEELSGKQREISVSEFFAKNRHLLGFDNPTRALLTAVKEAVDNSLDACEEAGVLPELRVEIRQTTDDRFFILVEDNGPGIVRAQVPKIFGKLLYGSKFHAMKQARGQQGIGISAAGLYAQLTTGKGVRITSRTGPKKKPHLFEIFLDTAKNEPVISKDEEATWKKDHGTRIEMELEARYVKGDKSVDEYLAETALANPHLKLTYVPPAPAPKNGEKPKEPEPVVYRRSSKTVPDQPRSIRPHPYGVELGVLIKMMQSTKSRNVKGFLQSDFSRVSPRIAKQILEKAGVPENAQPKRIARQEAEALYKAIKKTRIMAPPTDCLAPIGEEEILRALKANVQADFYTARTRPPSVYRGNPFQIEVGIAYGIREYPADDLAMVNRYANRVPLLYQ
ncbi:MAG: DNA topoisomerase VI subunit B, partial [Planctomycetota bacterium]